MKNLTRTELIEVVAALRACKKFLASDEYLAKRHGVWYRNDEMQVHICFALDNVSRRCASYAIRRGADLALHMISNYLATVKQFGCFYFHTAFYYFNPEADHQDAFKNMQKYRRKWVNQMIRDYTKMLNEGYGV